ncbi:MAG TPA: FG-GAP-like repeat-containing protein [Thermoanaerobaculia bacterium]
MTILAAAASAAAAPLAPKQPPGSWSTLRKFSTFDYCCQQPAVQFKRLGHEESFVWGSNRMFPPAGNGCGLGPNAYGASPSIVRGFYVPMDVDWDGTRPRSGERDPAVLCTEDNQGAVPCTDQHYDSVAFFAQMGHADWVVYTCDQDHQLTHHPAWLGGGGAPVDLTNPAVRQWQWAHMDEAAGEHFDAIAVDDVILDNQGSRCGVWRCDQPGACGAKEAIHPAILFRGDPHPGLDTLWSDAVLHWLSATAQHIHTVSTAAGNHVLGLVGNLYESLARDARVRLAVQALDGVLDEQGFSIKPNIQGVNPWEPLFDDGKRTDWSDRIEFMRLVQRLGRDYYSINQFNIDVERFPTGPPVCGSGYEPPQPSHAEIQFVLASFLMGKEEHAAIYETPWSDYGEIHSDVEGSDRYREDRVELGAPCGSLYPSQGVYVRDFEHGTVVVNPTKTTQVITWEDTFTTPYGDTMIAGSQQALPPNLENPSLVRSTPSSYGQDDLHHVFAGNVLTTSHRRCRITRPIFAAPVSWQVQGDFQGFLQSTGRFAGDGRQDLVLQKADATGWHRWVALANSDGSFSGPISTVSPGDFSGFLPSVGSFDAAHSRRDSVLLSRNDSLGWRGYLALSGGSGTFATIPLAFNFPGDFAGYSRVDGTDTDGDGVGDLLLIKTTANKVFAAVSRRKTAPSPAALPFTSASVWEGCIKPGCTAVAGSWNTGVGRFDAAHPKRNGLLLTANDALGWRAVVALPQVGGLSFRAPVLWTVAGDFSKASQYAADVDGDGLTDLVLIAEQASGLSVWVALCDGAGSFKKPTSWSYARPDTFADYKIAVGRFNDDPYADVLLYHVDDRGWRMWVAFGDGHGGFERPVPWAYLDDLSGLSETSLELGRGGILSPVLHDHDFQGWRTLVAAPQR